MALFREDSKFRIANEPFGGVAAGAIEFDVPENKLFKLSGADDPFPTVGIRQGSQFFTSGSKGSGIDVSNLPTFTSLPEFLRPDAGLGLTEDRSKGIEFFKGFQAGGTSPERVSGSFGAGGDFQTAGFRDVTTAPADTPTNPFFGIDAKESGKLQSADEAQQVQVLKSQGFSDSEAVAQVVGGRTGEAIPEGGGDKQATLTSPDGKQKTVVRVGSQEASNLLSSGWSLGTSASATVVDSESLKDISEIDLDGIDRDTQPKPATGSAIEQAKETANQIGEAISDLESVKKEEGLESEISKLIGETAGQEALAQKVFEEEGGEEFKRNLKNIRNELALRTADLEQELADIQATPQTMGRARGAKEAAIRSAQSRITFLTAQAQAMMGNISFAQDLAQDAVDAKYGPIFEKINIKTQQLKLIKDDADADTKLFISQLENIYAKQEDEVKAAAKLESIINDVTIRAISNKVTDTNVLSRIRNASSEAEALQILAENVPLKGTGGSTSRKVSSSITSSLIGGGFTEDEISIIDEFVRTNGVQSALDDTDLTNDQRNAIKSAYKVPETSLESGIEQSLKALGWTKNQIDAYNDFTNQTGQSISPEEFKRQRPELFKSSASDSTSSSSSTDFDNL